MKLPFAQSYVGKLRAKLGHELLIMPAVRIVLENESGEVLLVKRSDDGRWACPAGLPEVGDSAPSCARREVNEETGLTLGEFECFGFSSDPRYETHTYPNGDVTQSFVLLLCSKDFEGDPMINDDETTEVRFFKREELPPAERFSPMEYRSLMAYFVWKESGRFQWV